ncbi:hypothetical protein [Vulcanisaeta thermophila]|uniref:hypothetical protein n=1 Tax=Vulcanisaeta thermophila TaxID=867917 RepID=UPI001389B190|nr:hypothetical protein [Vulcanisaeta thermophila]
MSIRPGKNGNNEVREDCTKGRLSIRYSGFTYYEYLKNGHLVVWSGNRIYTL